MQYSNPYQNEIDGLRAIAVLAVIAFHYSEELVGSGFLGVDIFFVISGFVITKSISHYSQNTFGALLLDFYKRRVKRLFPALITCISLSGLVACLVIVRPAQTIATGITALFGLSNIFLYDRSADYFSESAASNIFTQTWSLGVEEQFYFMYPALFFLVVRVYERKHIFVVLLSVVSVCSATLFLYGVKYLPDQAFYLPHYRFWELATGALTYFFCTSQPNRKHKWPKSTTSALVLALIFSLFLSGDWAPISTFLVIVLTAMLLFVISTIPVGGISILSNPALRHIGLLSYSLYLWHWSVIVFAYWTVGISLFTAPVLLIFTYLLAAFSYYCVETKLRYVQWSKHNITTIAYGLSVAVVTAIMLYVLLDGRQTPSLIYLGNVEDDKWHSDSNILTAIENQQYDLENGKKVALQDFYNKRKQCHMTPHRLDPSAELYGPEPNVTRKFIENCTNSVGQQVLVIGDSFASVIADHVFVAASELGIETNILYGYGCPTPLSPSNYTLEANTTCSERNRLIESVLLDNLKDNDIVVIRAFYQGYNKTNRWDIAEYDESIDHFRELIDSKNARLLIIGSNATLNKNMPCTRPQWFNRNQCSEGSFSFSLLEEEINKYTMDHTAHLGIKHNAERSAVIDPLEKICDLEKLTCPVYKDGVLFYQNNDFNHWSAAAIDILLPEIRLKLSSMENNEKQIEQ